jgi:hypothetical protein
LMRARVFAVGKDSVAAFPKDTGGVVTHALAPSSNNWTS